VTFSHNTGHKIFGSVLTYSQLHLEGLRKMTHTHTNQEIGKRGEKIFQINNDSNIETGHNLISWPFALKNKYANRLLLHIEIHLFHHHTL
jgi:hypothetical protein